MPSDIMDKLFSNKKFLIIDDDEFIREYIHCILEDEGGTIFEAENGTKGLSQLSKQMVDLIITDLIMPDKEGIETIREIRHMHPQLKIIAMSGAVNGSQYLLITKALGAEGILTKPFTREELIPLISKILSEDTAV